MFKTGCVRVKIYNNMEFEVKRENWKTYHIYGANICHHFITLLWVRLWWREVRSLDLDIYLETEMSWASERSYYLSSSVSSIQISFKIFRFFTKIYSIVVKRSDFLIPGRIFITTLNSIKLGWKHLPLIHRINMASIVKLLQNRPIIIRNINVEIQPRIN